LSFDKGRYVLVTLLYQVHIAKAWTLRIPKTGQTLIIFNEQAIWQWLKLRKVAILISQKNDDVIYFCHDKLFEAPRLAARSNILCWDLKYFLASKTLLVKEVFDIINMCMHALTNTHQSSILIVCQKILFA
jgi:hypothetical protein